MPRSTLSLVFGTATWVVLAFLVLPILIVIPVSLTDTSFIGLPRDHLSLQHYETFLHSPEWLQSAWTSIWIGVVVAALATALGTAFCIGCWFLSDRAAMIARWILIVPILVPPVVQSLGFYKFWVTLGMIDTYRGVILAHTLLALPYVSISVFAALTNLDPRIPQAARNLGAPLGFAIRTVILPSIRPGMITGAVFAFIVSFDEIVGVLFLTVRRVETLPKMMWEGIQESINPVIAVVATLLVLISLLATCIVALRAKRTPA
ncbi:ABC transporter permease subunit [Pseudooceanicola sp. GBMRC 2024]|uniref:ABC transporter permease subunit n=1 Tax=Pseudooceanicola albus TaxID=2692189 RepID=A0A6L7G0C8_9RHOB|nr:ABC transporter permease [Pseudooceanicola albus]MXN17794.1 ABC transporter permease subunit [Pseudooceanicola albus]